MELFSLQFVLMVVGSVATYYLMGRVAARLQWVVLLVASILVYGLMGSWPTIALLLATALDVWYAGLSLDKVERAGKAARKAASSRDERKRLKAKTTRTKRLILLAALVVPCAILGYFKYANVVLFNLGLAESATSLSILLPLGISFYTFQSIGYLIDAYNAKYEPERSFPRFLLFVCWFPQIVQGPIGRFDRLAPQLVAERSVDIHGMRRALLLLGYGLFKKIAIANVLIHNVNSIFAFSSATTPGIVVLYGILAYSVQMYADFSGGIDIVEGISELFGVKMDKNFSQPYFSVSLADFWRRWHMSLGSWMRDYVFYPFALLRPMQSLGKWAKARLGTHAGRTLPACVANIVVFLFVGLWHGAEWHYLAWGLYNGVIVALSDLMAPAFRRLGSLLHVNAESFGYRCFAVVRTFAVVGIGRIFDRAGDLGQCFACLHNLFFQFGMRRFRETLLVYGIDNWRLFGIVETAVIGCIVVAIVSWNAERGIDVRERFLALPTALRVTIIGGLTLVCLSVFELSVNGEGGFLYANF